MAQVVVIFALIAALASSAYSQQVWKWVDNKGVTHYSDQPAPGAIRVDLHVQTYDSTAGAIRSDPSTNKAKAPAETYQSIRVTQPTNDQSLFDTGGVVAVAIEISPRLQSRDRVLLTIDGQQVAEPGTSTSFQLNDVPRGTHVLVASILDDSGTPLIRSDAVQFHVKQPVVRQAK